MNRGPDHPTYAPGRGNYFRRQGYVGYVSPYYYGSGIAYPVAAEPPASPESGYYPVEEPAGRLRLDILPAGQGQLFVDGEFVGMLEDVGGEIDLRPGPRRIEIRMPGYHPLVFDARIEAQRLITYRGALEPLERDSRQELPARREPAPPSVATGSRTIYVIPGCYLGNVMPLKEKLREGCDIAGMKTITP